MKRLLILSLLALTIFQGCEKSEENQTEPTSFPFVEREPIMDSIFVVYALGETTPVNAEIDSDAADDPAFWIHPTDPSQSYIYGSNKKGGLDTYDLDGNQLWYAPVGRINNIDVAYNLRLENEVIDICGGTNRTHNSLDLYRINPETGEVDFILDTIAISEVDEVYGFCFYNSPFSGKNYAILCGKDGQIEHYEILEGGPTLKVEKVSTFDIGTQPEGLVADHRHGLLYIGEETRCVWRLNAEPGIHNLTKLAMTTEENNPHITYDIEGLTMYYTSSDEGYLLVSSQGSNSYAIYNRTRGNDYIGSFKIDTGTFDRTTETDGIDVVNIGLGGMYSEGMFIAQDDVNVNEGGIEPQNFKMVSWADIANQFDPPLYIDNSFNVRSFFEP